MGDYVASYRRGCSREPKQKTKGTAATGGMARGGNVRRLPTTHPERLKRRDAKMWRRESERAGGLLDSKSRCPCTLCPFGRPLLRTTQARHLRDYGRHPTRRLQMEVPPTYKYVCMHNRRGRKTGIYAFVVGFPTFHVPEPEP